MGLSFQFDKKALIGRRNENELQKMLVCLTALTWFLKLQVNAADLGWHITMSPSGAGCLFGMG